MNILKWLKNQNILVRPAFLNVTSFNNEIIKSINNELFQLVVFADSARIFIKEWNKYIITPVAASPRLPSHSICPFNDLCLLHSIWTPFRSWISKDTRTRVCLSLIKSRINSWDIGVLLRRNVSLFLHF